MFYNFKISVGYILYKYFGGLKQILEAALSTNKE